MVTEGRKRIFIYGSILIGIVIIIVLFISRVGYTDKRFRHCKFGEIVFINRTTGSRICYPEFRKGPCPPDMILVPFFSNRTVGDCQCDNVHNNRTLLHHKESDKCYSIFTQGYCQSGHWIQWASNGTTKCEPNICLNQVDFHHSQNSDIDQEWVPLIDGSCAMLGKTHPSCKINRTRNDIGESSEVFEVIRFFRRKLYPACHYEREVPIQKERMVFGGVGVPQTECPEGFYKTELGHCAVEFDYR